MNQVDPRLGAAAYGRADTATYDAGLRSYMLSVYNYMLSGVLLTGLVAMGMYMSGAISALFSETGRPTILGWVVMFAPLAFIFFGFRPDRMSTGSMKLAFYAFAALMGASLSVIFIRYTGTSIASTFFATAAAFGGLSLYGYTTKRDLSGMGTFLIMGVVGLLVAMLLNLFIQSSALSFAISAIGVLIFAGLTAYDTQKIKNMYDYVAGTDMAGKAAIMGALTLYLDFVNMFQFLLAFLGNRE